MLVVFAAVRSRFNSQMIEDYDRMAKGVTQLMADRIDGDRIDEYIEKNFSSDEYNDIVRYFYSLRENYPDVRYIYAYRCEEDGGHIVFDLDAEGVENGEAYEPGYIYELEEPFASHQEEIMAGKETPGDAVRSEEDGYLYSYCRPVFRSDGSYACSVCVDFSLDQLSEANNAFSMRLMAMILGIGLIILLAEMLVVRRWVTDPINDLSKCAEKFAYDTEEDRRNNIELLDAVDIKSRDEIGDVYQMLRSVATDSLLSTSSLSQAREDIHNKEVQIDEISKEAYRDRLTHVGSRAAFRRDIAELSGEYALVMFDLNGLKQVNDTCGHAHGDLYIKGCCSLICEQYKHSPVYRIGGDEFIVLLRGEDYKNRDRHLREIQAAFEKDYGDSDPWERYSAASGMAVCRNGEPVDDIFDRADEAMYREKERHHREKGVTR